jgi:serine/threonine protein kinase/Tfp pilus assembly protein PilF
MPGYVALIYSGARRGRVGPSWPAVEVSMSLLEEQARAIFLAALEQAPERWPAFVDQACGDNTALRARVDELLRAHQALGSIPDRGAVDSLTPTIAVPIREGPGSVVDSYKLLERIGEGGFGIVFVAEQTQPVRRKVALKVLKAGMDTRQVVARFEAERQALAIMDHPNIAKVFGGGATASGRPYFVMELVNGVPITEFCDQNHLTPRQRLELFVAVCQAVQHAHQKGIIHRDLKPSNVLVSSQDTTPLVKVIDFGVAKALGQELTDKTLFTGAAQMIGTPLYMSPEQAGISELDIDTRSDIYSLGVLLYELLTGTTPFGKERFKKAAYDEIRRIIREEEPPTPSTRLSESKDSLPSISAQRQTEPAKLTKLVRGELDWIVMKAIEKDRNRRYETANSLAMDLQRYLTDEPVQACPPSAAYRLRKFARRNRRTLLTAAVLAFALLLTVSTIAASLGWAARDQAARQAAVEQEARRALDEAERWLEQDRWPEALMAAKRAEGFLAGRRSGELDEHVHRLRTDLEMILRLEDVALLATEVKNNRLDWDAVDQGYAKAFTDYGIDVLNLPVEEAAARIRGRERLAIPLAVALDDWASAQSSRSEADRTRIRAVAGSVDSDSWRRQVRTAVERRDGKALAKLADSSNLAQQPRNSLVVLKLGLRHGLRFHDLSEKSLEVLRVLQRQYPGDFWVNYWLAHELNWSPHADRNEAISFARAALAIRPKSAAAHLLLAISLQKKGKFDEAIISHSKAIELAPSYAYAHNELGWTLYRQGNLDEAVVCYQKASELDPSDAWPHFNLGNTLRDQNKLEEAIASFRKAIELDPSYAYAYHDLGWVLYRQGNVDEAIGCYRKAIELDPRDVFAHSFLGVTLQDQKKLDEAIASFQRAVDIDPRVVWAQIDLGNALFTRGNVNDAIVCFRKAIQVLAPADDQGRLRLGASLNNAAWMLAAASHADVHQPAIALELAKEAVRLNPAGYIWNTLGAAHYRSGDYKDAIAALEQSMKLRNGGDSLDWFFVAMAHWQMGENDLAREWYDKAVIWMEQNQPTNEQLHRFQAEAKVLIQTKKSTD